MKATVYHRKDNDSYAISYTSDAGKRVRKTIGKGDAARIEAQRLADGINARSDREGLSSAGPLPFAAVVEQVIEVSRAVCRPRSLAHLETTYRVHLAPSQLASIDIRDIRLSHISKFVGVQKDKKLSGYTIAGHLVLVRQALAYATREKLVPENPVRGLTSLIKKLRTGKGVSAWSHAEREVLLEEAKAQGIYLPVLIAFYTGCRKSELFGLLWKDIDFEKGTLHIRHQWDAQELRHVPCKFDSARRVPLAPRLKAAILDNGNRESEFVVTQPSGAALTPGSFDPRWQRVRAACNVPQLPFHSTRHSYATAAIEAGKSPNWASKALGHKDVAFTLRTYGHLLPDQEADTSFLDAPASGVQSHLRLA